MPSSLKANNLIAQRNSVNMLHQAAIFTIVSVSVSVSASVSVYFLLPFLSTLVMTATTATVIASLSNFKMDEIDIEIESNVNNLSITDEKDTNEGQDSGKYFFPLH